VRAYGAKGDGLADDTAAINAAISAANGAGGGTVEFPAGTYLAGSIHLMSRVELHLGPGSTILASSDSRAYDAPEANAWGDTLHYQDGGHSHWHDSLIWGEDLMDVAITGEGRIYGKGLSRGWSTEKAPQDVGNKAIALKNCRNVILRDFTIAHGRLVRDPGDRRRQSLTIDNLRIDTNRDGMDIDCCQNVRVSNCSVNSPGRRHLPEELATRSAMPGRRETSQSPTVSLPVPTSSVRCSTAPGRNSHPKSAYGARAASSSEPSRTADSRR
jgi:polygalacturonase